MWAYESKSKFKIHMDSFIFTLKQISKVQAIHIYKIDA